MTDMRRPEGGMTETDVALARFTAALARLERAASRVAGRDDAMRVQAAAIARLKRENEQLRAAQVEEARLREETLAQVDRAMAAVEEALSGRFASAPAEARPVTPKQDAPASVPALRESAA